MLLPFSLILSPPPPPTSPPLSLFLSPPSLTPPSLNPPSLNPPSLTPPSLTPPSLTPPSPSICLFLSLACLFKKSYNSMLKCIDKNLHGLEYFV